MECSTPPPSASAEVIVESVGPLYYIEYPVTFGWPMLAVVIGILVVGRRRYPGLTPILVGILVVTGGFLAVSVLASTLISA